MVRIKNPEQTARWFRALGDETRLRILERLSEGEQVPSAAAGRRKMAEKRANPKRETDSRGAR